MLDIKILKTDYSVSYGSVTLKSLQNDNVPELDLLVREAIQNSSDAALGETDADSYVVNFNTGVFKPAEFNSLVTDLEDVLNQKFSTESADFLEIRDTKTSGLTGPIRKKDIKKDDHGNFFKLIYDTGKQQTAATAGGNWGFGKSVYYRVGIGMVIFYSRIKTDSGYENRMIFTLVEKEDAEGNDEPLLNQIEPNSAGKAWWGIKDGKDLLPLTDMEKIQSVLDVFHIKPFKEKQTGTSIIIPYINTEALLNGIIPVEAEIQDDVRDHFISAWTSTLPDYLTLCIQKWYAPKIHNRNLKKFCKNKWLHVSVQDKPIRKQDMCRFFRLAQDLYTAALAQTYSYSGYTSEEFPQIKTIPVKINSYFESKTIAGYVAVAKITKAELYDESTAFSPYDYIGMFERDGGLNDPIMMYARDPGMIIEYAVTGDWVKSMTVPGNPDDFLFAFFVPTTDAVIKHDLAVPQFAGRKLGEYLRTCEASDHMGWRDQVKMQIVLRIQKNCINKINKFIKDSQKNNLEGTPSKLSNKLGMNLLPKLGYGKKPKGGNGGGPGGGGKAVKKVDFQIMSQSIRGDEIEMEFVLKLSHEKRKATVSVMIASEVGWIDAASWENDIGTDFPIEIIECYIESVKVPILESSYEVNQVCRPDSAVINREELTVQLLPDKSDSVKSGFIVEAHLQNAEVSGKVKLHCLDKKYQFMFGVE